MPGALHITNQPAAFLERINEMKGSVAERVVQRHRRGQADSKETQTIRRRGRARRRGLLRQPDGRPSSRFVRDDRRSSRFVVRMRQLTSDEIENGWEDFCRGFPYSRH